MDCAQACPKFAPADRSIGEMAAASESEARGDRICVIIPFFNEEQFIGETLASLAAQTLKPASFILVDNGSTDRSAEICLEFKDAHKEIPVKLLCEARPGKIHALETACRHIDAKFVAFCDADTTYPPHYLDLATRLFQSDRNDLVAVMAVGLTGDPHAFSAVLARIKSSLVARLLAKQCHSGGFGQVFRTSALMNAGGYSVDRWPYVLEDHEIMQRLLKLGRLRYHPDLYCRTSARRKDRSAVSWTTFEQIVYHCTPFHLKDWYFSRFLAPRLAGRGQINARLRDKSWTV